MKGSGSGCGRHWTGAGAADARGGPQNREPTLSQRNLSPLRPLPPIYGGAAQAYASSGLGSPVPLKPRRKAPPVKGFTGKDGKTPTQRRIDGWVRTKAQHNLALRLAPGLLGLDVDCYDGRVGAQTLALGQERWGPLPATVRSSSRHDGSGIYLYQVPLDVMWPSVLTADLTYGGPPGNIELIHFGLRYAVCWPSIHPKGPPYLWWDEDGPLEGVPKLEDLPYLPEGWVQGLSALARPPVAPATSAGSPQVRTALQAPRYGSLCELVAGTPEGQRNEVLNRAAFVLAGDLTLGQDEMREDLVAAGVKAGLSKTQATSTFDSGWAAGRKKPYR